MDNKIPGKAFPRVDLKGMANEVLFVLMTYALALSNFADMQDVSLGQKALCKAAGIHSFLAASVCTAFPSTNIIVPEQDASLHRCLAELALGRAQVKCLSLLESKTSDSVLCRVAVGAADHFSAGIGLMSSHAMLKVLPQSLSQALALYQKKATLQAYLYLGKERAKLGQVGFAVACARYASSLGPSDGQTETLLREWTTENNKVTFQSVPAQSEVLTQLPSGREFVKATPFVDATQHEGGGSTTQSEYY